MNTPVVNAPPMGMKAIRWGKNVADETAEKFISSLEMFVWCERPPHNSTSHEGLVWGINVLIFGWVFGKSGVFRTG